MNKTWKVQLAMAVSGITIAFAASSAEASSYCMNKYGASAASTKAVYEPQFAHINAEIKRVQDAGLKPENYLIEHRGQMLTLVQASNNLAINFREEMAKASGEADGCMAAVAPADLLVNGSIKLSAIWATYGLALLLPDAATHVDVGEIAHGKPFGGDGAIVPQLRELILKGDNGFIANLIRDPWKCISFQRKC